MDRARFSTIGTISKSSSLGLDPYANNILVYRFSGGYRSCCNYYGHWIYKRHSGRIQRNQSTNIYGGQRYIDHHNCSYWSDHWNDHGYDGGRNRYI